MIKIFKNDHYIASFIKDNKEYLIDYKDFDIKNSISLSLPNTKRFYTYDFRFPPFFESFLPEGYLYEVFKNILTKEYGYIDDYLIFSKLCANITAPLSFQSESKALDFDFFTLEDVLENDNEDTFSTLLQTFLKKNAISGVQPKTLALLYNKESLNHGEYIIKTWNELYNQLAYNEYFCLKACEYAGLDIPQIQLSKNKKFLVVKNFTITDEEVLGFEEVLSLMNKNRERKYEGSFEQVAKIIYSFTSEKRYSLKQYFKMIIMNYLLKNGDAHLKNFGLLYKSDFSFIKLSPVYDVVNTTSYIFKDKPALTMFGKKVWWGRNELVEFGIKHCLLTKNEAQSLYDESTQAVIQIIDEIEIASKDESFAPIARRMIDTFALSLEHKTIKELPVELTRTW